MIWKRAFFVVFFVCAFSAPGLLRADNNGVDEDGDGWLETTHGFSIRAAYPRIVTTPQNLPVILARMCGPQARDPYARWFQLVKDKEDQSASVSLCNLALIYRATGDATYLQRLLDRWPTSGDPQLEELYALDLVFDEIPDTIKRNIMQRVSDNDNCWYWNSVNQSHDDDVSWGYHSAIGVARAAAYAGLFALSDLELNKDPEVYRFDCLNYLTLVHEELSPGGYFYRIENRVGGDPSANDALPGSPGGMYDNFGYDSGEESYSIHLLNEYENLTGNLIAEDFRHDRYRGTFWQNFQYPHRFTHYDSDQWAHRAGTEIHNQSRVWFTQQDRYTPATHATALAASRYSDARMQDYAANAVDVELTGYDYDLAFWFLMFYDDAIVPEAPHSNPTAYYASGPGLVSMRSDWTNEAAYAFFICGDGISRRYEDANSFEIHRKADVIVQAGARIRNNFDNGKHHWYTVRSAAKNTLKVFDPDECFDRNLGGDNLRGPLHSGDPLVTSANLGGQMFETLPPASDGEYSLGGMPFGSHPSGLSYNEMGNILKFEHVPAAYTYAVGDGSQAYTRKIDYFEREFVFLRPDVFVIFDRVRSVDPSYKKVWTLHTVDEPSAAGETFHGMGYKSVQDGRSVTITNPLNTTRIDLLLPQQNRVEIRGGDTILSQGRALTPASPLGEADFLACDIPRWLEIFAIGPDVTGSLTITGEAQEGSNVSEVIDFDGTVQTYVTSSPTALTSTTLSDDTRSWQTDQWTGYVLRLRGGEGGDYVISGNDADTLVIAGGIPTAGIWGYYILRPLANSYYHWKRITAVTTSDMTVDNLIVSTPHYFDARDARGNLYSFAPHTDGRDDAYRKRADLGQWTLEIEARDPQLADVFLNVISLKDPGVAPSAVTGFEGQDVSGALVDDRFVVFANGREALENVTVTIPAQGAVSGLVCDLVPLATYTQTVSANTLTLTRGSGPAASEMGLLTVSAVLSDPMDLTGDGAVDIRDVIRCTLIVNGSASGEADFNADGQVDAQDVEMLVNRIVAN